MTNARHHGETYRELTWAAVILGIVQGIVLNVAFVYVALKLGFSIGGSTVAAIMGYAVLRGLLRRGTMVENNINQTIASGINTAGTGIVFTVPALYLLQAKLARTGEFDFQLTPLVLSGIAGALLGVVVILPLRKQMIELDRLRFPSGVATATIIQAGAAGTQKAILLAIGFAISVAWKLLLDSRWLDTPGLLANRGFGILGEELHFGFGMLPDYLSPVVYLSLMNVAAGLLAGRGGLPFFVGGVVAWWFISPWVVQMGWLPPGDYSAGVIRGLMLRPLGIGVIIGGALMGVVTALPAIRAALGSLRSAARLAGTREPDEMSIRPLGWGMLAALVLFFAASRLTPGVTTGQALVSALVGTLWLALAALIVAEATGLTDISPMSGMALISVTLMMFLLNKNVAGAMVVGVAVSVAIGQGADMMQDLKTGFLVGARPIKQQIAQLATTWIGVLVALGVVHLLWTGTPSGEGGFGEGTALEAPQAGALMAVIEAVGADDVPVDKYALGAAVGAALGLAPQAGLGVLIGLAMYLPFSIVLGYGLGCLLQMAIERRHGIAFCEHKLVPLAAGLIVGEAIAGVGRSVYLILAAS